MRIFWRILAALVLIAAIVGVGFYAYGLGFAQKVATTTTTNPVPAPYAYPWPHYYGFGFGWGFLGCLIPLFLFFLILGSFRAVIGHGPMGWRRHWHHHGPWGWHDEEGKEGKEVPPFFAEMHRRMHANPDWDKAPEDKQK